MVTSPRIALVTGAGRGVGAGIATALGAAGVAVAVNDLHGDRAAAVAEAIGQGGGRAVGLGFDVTDRAAIDAAMDEVDALLGPVDILVNNAGIAEGFTMSPFLDTDPGSWSRDLELNLFGSLHCIHAVAPGMVARGWGRIIQISSGAAAVGLSRGLALYGASKGAVEAMVRHLAVELGPSGVTVNAVSLGVMDNLADGDPERYRRAGHAIPVRRLGRPEDAGAAVSWLASEDGAYVTGQIVHVNGGAVFGR